MSEFKYACPVCGQHIKCDTSEAGTTMECPTCFQRIIVPQPPATNNPGFIIAGTKVGEPTLPSIPAESRREVPAERNLPLAVMVVLVILLALFGAGVMLVIQLRGKLSRPPNAPAQAMMTNNENHPVASAPPEQAPAPSPAASLDSTNWTLDLGAATIPDLAVAGYVHGKVLIPAFIVLNEDGLTLRTAENPPEAGVTIYLQPNPIESLFGKSVVIKTDTSNAPMVNLRWKDARGQAAIESVRGGYALRIEFGQPVGNQLPGKIYLCTPDEKKSWLMGAFNAEILKPK
jgi:DNA-directed RNA polymerase subunit RPC12/RpoP